ncbi:hypothetical protein N665_0502s0008 [Sinapis alba]|nr:hypothetical protein N665_0502s0008 [Sinapis alba]
MVFIRESSDFANDENLVVFPPVNHENLYIDGFDRDRESSSTTLSSSSSSSSSFDSDGRYEFDRNPQFQPLETDVKSQPSDSSEKSRWTLLNYYSTLETNIIQRCWKLLLPRVFSKFQNMVSCLCSFSETLRSFYPVIVIVTWWWLRNRARRRFHGGETEAYLRDTIKERDERITQLLHQIAQMNELLIDKKHSN